MPKTMTRIESVVQPSGSQSTVVTVLGGEKVGTTDRALGDAALLAWEKSKEDMWEIDFEQRGERLYLLGFEVIEAPEELGGPSAADGEPAASTAPEPDFSLESLLNLAARVQRIEEHLGLNGE